MSSKRHKGYVVFAPGESSKGRVRVKDPTSSYNGESFIIASTHEGIQLAKGLNVSFLVGNMDGKEDEQILRAVDVALEETTSASSVKRPNAGGCDVAIKSNT